MLHQYENSVERLSFWKPLHTFGDGPIGVRNRQIVTFERFGCAFGSESLKCHHLTTPHNGTAPKIMWGFQKVNLSKLFSCWGLSVVIWTSKALYPSIQFGPLMVPLFFWNIIELYPTQWDRPQNYVGHQYENSVE
jgi:hypothetical protein